MSSNLRISGHIAPGPAIAESQAANARASGTWRGQAFTLAPAGAAKAATQAHESAMQSLATTQSRDLSSRRVAAEAAFKRMPAGEVLQRASTMGVDLRRVRSGARDILSGNQGAARGGRSGSAARYMSLQLAAASMEDNISEEAATAMLTPVKSQAHTPQDFSELLRHSANDDEEFQHFLEDILSGLDITADDAKELGDKLKQARNDDEKLMKLLAKVQNLPQPPRETSAIERERIRQRIHDELREFERSNEGAMVLASFNAAPVAATTAEPASFLDTYTELVTVPRTFAGALKVLLQRHRIDTLEALLSDLKKALGDDLSAATPSHDTRRLGAVLTDLGNMVLSSSLIESVAELVDLMRRIERKQEEKNRRCEREEHENDVGDEPARALNSHGGRDER
ncbi:hypothetical protein [Caenimonas sp. SL110]|uniref:hypothetical protein n=1 Tax=Caenimonas sp. SL110 TaxID=1450524 RepID=UPI000652CBFB|nr:hypothetical protein [Caenimonas sp. SL110]